MVKPEHDVTSKKVALTIKSGDVPPVLPLPLCALRYLPHLTESPSGALDDIGLRPHQFLGNLFLWPSGQEGCTSDEMLEREPRDQVWEIAYDLTPELQGRGVGSAVIKAALEGWIQWIGIGTVIAVSGLLLAYPLPYVWSPLNSEHPNSE